MSKHSLTILFIFIFVASTAGILWAAKHPSSSTAAAKASAAQPPAPRDTTAFDASIASTLSRYSDLDISISVADLTTGATYHYGDTASFEAASVDKLVTAVLFLHQVEQRSASLTAPLGNVTAGLALQKLIILSDNAAWQDFNQLLTHDGLNAYARSIGLTSYDANNNTIGSNDITLLLTKLYKQQLLNSAHTQLLLTYMQQASERDFVVAAVPTGAVVYHKVGYLKDRLHEAAIVTQNGQAYAIAIFSKAYSGTYDGSIGHTLFGEITQAANQTFLH